MVQRLRNNKRRKRPNMRRMIQSVLNKNIETKEVVLSLDQNTVGTQAVLPLDKDLNAMAQGLTQNLRVGNAIRTTGMYSKLTFHGADTTNVFRVLFYIPHDINNTISLDVYEALDLDRHTVLLDKTFSVVTSTSKDAITKEFKLSFKRKGGLGLLTQFSGAGAANLSNGAIKMHIVSDSIVVSHPTVSGVIRTYFKDG